MKKMSLPLFAIVLTVFISSSNSFAQGVPEAKSDADLGQQGQVKTIFSFKDQIALTDDQEVKLKALLYDEQTAQDADNAALKTLGTQLGKMIDDKADMQLIKSKLEEISKVQVGISYRNIEDSRNAETILTPAQLEKWREIQKSFSAQPKQ